MKKVNSIILKFSSSLAAGRYRLQFEKLLYLGETVYYEAVQECPYWF